jgi:hypothetical protein
MVGKLVAAFLTEVAKFFLRKDFVTYVFVTCWHFFSSE